MQRPFFVYRTCSTFIHSTGQGYFTNFNGFRIDDTALLVGEAYYDLHNCYQFRSLSYDVNAHTVTLEWIVSVADYVPEGSPGAITVIMSDVSSFIATPRDPNIGYSEDDCLNTSMIVNDDMIRAFGIGGGGITLHEPHFMLEFMSGFVLMVRAAEAHCTIEA